MADSAILDIAGLTKTFGGMRASDDITLQVADGEAHAIIGPNGAGKTTLINQIAGELRPDRGSIRFLGQSIAGGPSWRVACLGVGRSFQQSNVFPEFSVFENIRLAAQRLRQPRGLAGHLGHYWHRATASGAVNDATWQTLHTVGLAALSARPAAALSHGERRQLELGMVLVQAPRLLLLDEPMAGLSLEESRRVTELLLALKQQHTLVLVEHDMDAVFAIADRITVLVYGQVIATGTPEAIRTNAAVRDAYLGDE